MHDLLTPPLAGRLEKPRLTGKTMVIDKGLGIHALTDLLETASPYMDCLKLGFGTASLYRADILKQKAALCRQYGVDCCTGGTLTEIVLTQGIFPAFLGRCRQFGLTAIEISDGTLSIPASIRTRAIEAAAKHFLVITEVGKKLEAFPDAGEAAAQILTDLEAGAALVIVEGRESGECAGIYEDSGKLRDAIVDQLAAHLPASALSKVMWEAPKKSQQTALIQRFGNQVNLGNIAPSDVLSVECLRRGLRADTLTWTRSE